MNEGTGKLVVICKMCGRRLTFDWAGTSKRQAHALEEPNRPTFVWVSLDGQQVPTVACPEDGELGPVEDLTEAVSAHLADKSATITVRLRPGY